ncbi:hypothetical protein B0I35DRAFT_427333 [Stachybotrys elegans]|uniref:Ester cyclase n=1 Tax=Stachybotrys elegans TaxID=80388 RepID=A0A8K0SUP4_9HYPO|nr:hypothetical protein B0I35DRAFT_427333 [Stachybotrys elegans]
MATQAVRSPTTPQDDERRKTIDAYGIFCNAHDFSGMRQFYASPININDEPWTPAQVTAQFEPIVAAFPDWHWDFRHLSIDGDYIACHFKVTGTHKGEFRGIKPTGRRITTMQFTLYHLVDGKFVDVWDLTDMDAVMKQIQD